MSVLGNWQVKGLCQLHMATFLEGLIADHIYIYIHVLSMTELAALAIPKSAIFKLSCHQKQLVRTEKACTKQVTTMPGHQPRCSEALGCFVINFISCC